MGRRKCGNNNASYKQPKTPKTCRRGKEVQDKVKVINGMVGEGVRFERIRRITGYLVGDISKMNNGKRAEVKDRLRHM